MINITNKQQHHIIGGTVKMRSKIEQYNDFIKHEENMHKRHFCKEFPSLCVIDNSGKFMIKRPLKREIKSLKRLDHPRRS